VVNEGYIPSEEHVGVSKDEPKWIVASLKTAVVHRVARTKPSGAMVFFYGKPVGVSRHEATGGVETENK
jgi:hypothetical protein